LNPTTYQKDHSPRPSWLHPIDAGMVKHMQIIKCNAALLTEAKTKTTGSSQ
jgi:hypothetical protein